MTDKTHTETLQKKGKVWLVGAGPGDPGLLTVKGREVLENAQVVVYDRLVGDGVLSLIPRGAEAIDVGKRGGCHPVPQDEIERILINRGMAGLRVVRLKGGDPFLFGRGAEEWEALSAAGVPCCVVCGVTSAIAAAAYGGIPVTHRDYASSVHIITAHSKSGSLADTDYEALVRLKGTLVFLMGVSALPEVRAELVRSGMSADTPAAVIERGTTARQRVVSGTLRDIHEKVRDAGVQPPALIVIGKVAALNFDWRASLPLAGRCVLVTRPTKKCGVLSAMLRDRGAHVIEYPCIDTKTLDTPLPPLCGYAHVGFTSATGVESLFELLRAQNRDIREVGGAKIAAIGPATAEALRIRGLKVDYMPEIYDGHHLGRGLSGMGGRILMFRARDGSPDITEALAGSDFTEVPVYETLAGGAGCADFDFDTVVFTSASTVRGFAASCGVREVFAVCIGEQTAQAARDAGFKKITIAEQATIDSLANAVGRT